MSACEGDLLDELMSRCMEKRRYKRILQEYGRRVGYPVGKSKTEMLSILEALDKKQEHEDVSSAADQDMRME